MSSRPFSHDAAHTRLDDFCSVNKQLLQIVIQGMVVFFSGYCLYINPSNNWGHVCCVVEVNFLIPCVFSFAAPAPTPQLTTSTTSATTPSPFTIKTHMSHSLTSHVTESPTKVKATETPDVTLSKTTTKSTDPITEVTSTRTVDPIVQREDETTGSVTTRTMVIVIVVAGIAVVVVTLLIALFLCRKKRYELDVGF